jgi:hypothetical protein
VSLCLQTEQAIARWLRSGQNLRLWRTNHGSYVVNDRGINIKFHSGFELTIAVLTDEGDVADVEMPVIIASCTQLTEPESLFPIGNHVGEASVVIKFPADKWSEQPDVLAALEDTAVNVYRALFRSDLPERLSEQVENFTCLAVQPTRQQTRDRDGRIRIYMLTLNLQVCARDFVEEPEPQLLP